MFTKFPHKDLQDEVWGVIAIVYTIHSDIKNDFTPLYHPAVLDVLPVLGLSSRYVITPLTMQ